MKKILIGIFALLSCNAKPKLVDNKNLSHITVYVNKFHKMPNGAFEIEQDVDTLIITDKEKISKIIGMINTGSRYTVKFFPDYSLDFHYNNTIQSVLVSNNYCKVNGLTYMMRGEIDRYLKGVK